MLKAQIAPSMLSCDFSKVGAEVDRMMEFGADWLHLDIMDGHFVNNITFGPPLVKSIRQHAPNAFLDCHLMVENPEKWVEPFSVAGASQFVFHIEATDSPKQVVAEVRKRGMRAGIAIKPPTQLDDTFWDLLGAEGHGLDMVLIMTVNPGFGGQSFMADQMPKVTAIRQKFPHLDIQVDGGLAPNTVAQAAQAGANVIVAGSAIFKAPSPPACIADLRRHVDAALGKPSS